MQNKDKNDITNSLVQDLLQEKRADRRWKNIRFVLWFILIIYLLVAISRQIGGSPLPSSAVAETRKYVALIHLDGMIAPGREFSANEITPILKSAFKDKNSLGLIININSPGGTPVQASIIHDAIITLKKKYRKKVIIIGEDSLTSGAYYVAVAGDKIYVNPNTVTGSIGVIMKGFGFVDLIKKVGVERRVYTVGNDKDRLDPFLPQNPNDVKKIQEVMSEVQQNFIQAVLEGRKGKLKADPSILFNGDFWSGQKALELGLVDGLGNFMDVIEKEFKTSKYKEFDGMPNIFRLLGGQISTAMDTWMYTVG